MVVEQHRKRPVWIPRVCHPHPVDDLEPRAIRVEATWAINEKHGIRLLAAPLSYEETGFLAARTRFAGAAFAPCLILPGPPG